MCRSVRGMEGCRRRRRLHSPDNEIESPSSSHFLCITPTDAEGPSEEALLLFLCLFSRKKRMRRDANKGSQELERSSNCGKVLFQRQA